MYIYRVIVNAVLISFTSAEILSTATYNGLFDDETTSVKEFACWNENKDNVINYMGWDTLAHLSYVIAGYEGVDGPNSSLCGSCWLLEYEGRSRPMIVLDTATSGFTTDFKTMDSLTGGKALKLGRVNVTAIRSPTLKDCGIFESPEEEEVEEIAGGRWLSNLLGVQRAS
ncbi:hypothetical protein ACHAPU_007200 [Fusarium lateritium]